MPHTAIAAADQDPDNRVDGLLHERYRSKPEHAVDVSNATLETLLSHRSVRAYLPRRVPPEALDLAIAAAQSAPSSSNLQAWSVIAIEDPALKSQLNAFAGDQRQITEAPLLLIWLADLSRLRSVADTQGQPSAGLDYLESFLIAAIDATLAAQNALVALESQGFGTCYIGAIRNHPDKVAEALGLPEEVVAVFGMTVGYPDPDRPASIKPRLARETILHRDSYRPTPDEEIARYDIISRAFQTEQSLPAVGWSRQASQRIGSAAALKNRDKLREALQERGFQLK